MSFRHLAFAGLATLIVAVMMLTVLVPRSAQAAAKEKSYTVGCSGTDHFFTNTYTRHLAAQLCGTLYQYQYDPPLACTIDTVTPSAGGRDLCH